MKLVFTERRMFPVQGVLCSEQPNEVVVLSNLNEVDRLTGDDLSLAFVI